MKTNGVFFLVLSFLAACSGNYDHKGKTPLVELDGQFLYREDLRSVLPAGLSKDDSVLFAEHYIKNWLEDQLLYEKAESNIPDNSEIDRLVDNYRKALIVHTYQQGLVEQKLSEEITGNQVKEYYDRNAALFLTDIPLIKGLFVKVPVNSPQLGSVRKWYKKNTPEAVDKLEKYSLRNAVEYDYFYDKWISAVEIVDKMPLKVQEAELYLKHNRNIELRDSAYCYFLNVTEYLDSGEQEPFEYAREKARDLLLNLNQVEFMRGVKKDLYENATRKKKIKYYY